MRILTLLAIVITYSAYGQVKSNPMTNSAKKILRSTDTSQSKQGHYKYYYSNGKLQEEGNYVDDKKEGLWKSYWSNGNIEEESVYVDDVPDGYYRAYTKAGVLRGIGFKKYGVLDGTYFIVDTAENNVCILTWKLGLLKSEKILVPYIKPEGTEDTINGVKYIWRFGEPLNEDSLPKSKMPYKRYKEE
jgi:antitoxin component YwqK of YwqJK toxin-antitoxin module